MSRGHQAELERDRLRHAAQRSRPYGHRTEEGFPLRPPGLQDIDVRQGDAQEQTGEALIGIDTVIGTFTT
jgi:hypothetical protein